MSFLRWLLRRLHVIRPEGQACESCWHFDHYPDPDDEHDEPDGYCCHPVHRTAQSPHEEYGGHWTHHASWCLLWEGEPVAPAAEREQP